MTARPALFVDRDGVVVEEVGYVVRPEQLRILDAAIVGLREVARRAHPIVVVTNQSAVARGLVTEQGLAAIHAALAAALAGHGIPLAGIYHCPHHVDGVVSELRVACACRKPQPGLLRRAAQDLGLALDARSVFVGDQPTDCAAARAAGVRPVLVRTGKGAACERDVLSRWPEVSVRESLADVAELLAP